MPTDNATEQLGKYIGQILNGAHLDPGRLYLMAHHIDQESQKLEIIAEAIIGHHLQVDRVDVITTATQLTLTKQIDDVDGLPGLMVLIDEYSERCPHCDQPYVAPTSN